MKVPEGDMFDLDLILPAKTLGISRLSTTPGDLSLALALNTNDKATAFAGSIFSLAVLSGYDTAFERQRAICPEGNLYLVSSQIAYHQPGLSDLAARSRITKDFAPTKKANWKIHISVEVVDTLNNVLCATFEGLYVLQVEPRNPDNPGGL